MNLTADQKTNYHLSDSIDYHRTVIALRRGGAVRSAKLAIECYHEPLVTDTPEDAAYWNPMNINAVY